MNSVFTADLLSAVAKVNSKCQVILCNSIYALAKDSAPLDIKRDENNIVASLDQSTNIYAMSKKFSLQISDYFRSKYNLPVWNLLLNNHEDILRDPCFLPRKLSIFIAEIIVFGKNIRTLELGDLDAARDWSSAKNIVLALASVTSKLSAGNYILGSGQIMTVRELILLMFSCMGIPIHFVKNTESEKIYCELDNSLLAVTTAKFSRKEHDWIPSASTELITYLTSGVNSDISTTLKEMIEYDVELLREKNLMTFPIVITARSKKL